jgi:hypothetical protein
MKYLLIILSMQGGAQTTYVTREQCYAVVQMFNKFENTPAAFCFPPDSKFELEGGLTGG